MLSDTRNIFPILKNRKSPACFALALYCCHLDNEDIWGFIYEHPDLGVRESYLSTWAT